MQQEEQIIVYLKQLTSSVGFISEKVNNIDQKVDSLCQRIDTLEKRIDALEQKVDGLEKRIDALEQKVDGLDKKIDSVKSELEEKIDSVEYALDKEIDKVYKIALENKYSIDILLIPYNDRNHHINNEVDKVHEIDRRLDDVEAVVGTHSEAIRKLQATLA